MATQALIVDQASGVRSLFARVLRSLNCVTHEASDGGEAVEILERHDIALAVIEAESGLLSGLDLLRLLRDSDKYANLPVVIVTGGADQATVTEMVRLGAADCLTKPFDVELIKSRLQRIIKSLSATDHLHTAPSSEPGQHGTALIVDANAEFRHFVANCLMASYATTQLENGLEALRACQVRKFTVLVMGTDTGLLAPRLLARRLRRQTVLDDMRIVLVVPKGAARDVADSDAFDAILHRTYVPEEFTQQFRQLFSRSQSGEAGILGDVRVTVVSATEQALGMMAQTDVSLMSEADATEPGLLEASSVMNFHMERAAVKLCLRADLPSASRIAANMTGVPVAEVPAEDALSAMGEVLNVIAGRVKSQVSSEGGTMVFTIPALRNVEPDAPTPDVPVILHFASADRSLRLSIGLCMAEHQEAAA